MGLEFQDIHHQYDSVEALSGVSLSIDHGEILCLLGRSGCGKSTLLNLVAGNLAIQSGRVTLNEGVLASPSCNPPPEKRSVGIVFQEGALFPHLTIAQNIGFGVRDKQRRPVIVAELLEQIGLKGFENRFPHSLSGGQQQRVAVARALALEPAIILLDEPFASIDIMLRRRLREELRQILKKRNCITIFVTHDPEEAFETADKIAVMEEGVITQVGSAEDLYNNPASLLVALMAGEGAILEGRKVNDSVQTSFGGFPINKLTVKNEVEGDQSLKLLLRPFTVNLIEDSKGVTVIDVRRTGNAQIVTLQNQEGRTVLLQVASNPAFVIGQKVIMDVTDKAVLAFA